MTFEDPPRWLPPSAEQAPPPLPEPSTPPQHPAWAPFAADIPVWVPFATLFAVLVIATTFGAAVIGIVAAADPSVDPAHPPVNLVMALTAVQDFVFVFGAWLAVRLALGSTPRAQFGLRRVKDVRQAVLWAIAVYAAFWLVTGILSSLWKPEDQELVKDVKAEDSAVVLGIYFVLICLIAPFVEELFFRGFMYTVLWRRLGPVWAALIVGAVFGLGHAPAPVVSLIALGTFGVGLCLLYWRTESIVPGMALHALNNSITFGAVKSLDPALFVGVVLLSVGIVTAAGTLLSARATVTA